MLAQKPPMGWNSWNTFAEKIDEQLIIETTDAFIEKGYKDAGYEYIIIDDCWSLKERDENGRLVPDPKKFPHGMKYIADYIHSKGLKFGMYSCAGVMTCAGYPGSYGHEYIDAKTFAEWEVDYLKYDYCHFPHTGDGKNAYLTMSMALRSCGREIMFAACNWGSENPWEWMRSIGAHSYRSTGDICDIYTSFKDIAIAQGKNFSMSAPGCYNDIDMLIVGMYGKGFVGMDTGRPGCSDDEYKLHFALWCMLSAPLIMGGDIRNMNEYCEKLMLNKDLIAINQDEEGRPPIIINESWSSEIPTVYFKILANNEVAIMFTNFSDREREIPLYLKDVGVPYESGMGFELYDVFTGKTAGIMRDYYNAKVVSHSCVLLKGKLKPM